MDAMRLVETAGSSMGSEALAAGAGAFIGSWFGNGFGDRGGWGHGGGMPPVLGLGNVGGGEAAAIAATSIAAGASITNDKLDNIDNQLNNLGMNLIQGQGQNALTACQGFNGINSAIYQTSAAQVNAANQGYAGLNTAIVTQGYESRLASADIIKAMADCCCSTQKVVAAEGAATRQLMLDQATRRLEVELCDAKAANIALRQESALLSSQYAQTQQLLYAIDNS